MMHSNTTDGGGSAAGDIMALAADGAANHARWRCPELSLAEAVLEDAVYCLRRVSCGVTHQQCREAFEWFESDRRDWPFAFISVCDVLGMDAAAVRTRLRNPDNGGDESSPTETRAWRRSRAESAEMGSRRGVSPG